METETTIHNKINKQDAPEGYKHTEVCIIPKDWEIFELSKLSHIETGSTPPTLNREYYGNEFMFVSPGDLGKTKWISKTEKYLSRKGFNISRKFPAKSILVACIGSTIGKIGMAATKLTSNQQINAIFPNNSILNDFLYYQLSINANKIKQKAAEQAVPILNKTKFGEIKIPIPTLKEQRAIATALSDVDNLIESLEKLIAKKQDIKKATMQQLLTGKKRLPGFEGEWEVKRFPEIMTRINNKNHQIKTIDYRNKGKYPVIDQGQEKVIGYSDRNDKVFNCPKEGIIVFGDHTCIVKFINFNFIIGADGTQLIKAKDGYSTQFYSYQLQYNGIKPTGYNRHFKFLKEYKFKTPPFAEQKAIAKVLSDMDSEIEGLEHRLEKTKQIKQGMMQELLTGRIRLNDQVSEP